MPQGSSWPEILLVTEILINVAEMPVYYLQLSYPKLWASWPRTVQSIGWPVTISILFLPLTWTCIKRLRLRFWNLEVRGSRAWVLLMSPGELDYTGKSWRPVQPLTLGPDFHLHWPSGYTFCSWDLRYPLSTSNKLSFGGCVIFNRFLFLTITYSLTVV